MPRPAIYKTDGGAINRFVCCPYSLIQDQCGDGEEFYLNCPDTATHIIDNEPVTIVPEVVPPTLGEVKAKKYADIRAASAKEMLAIAAPYLPQERESWDTQFKEATDWLADNGAAVPMITAMANNRGITVVDMVGKIVENANLYRNTIGELLGKQQRLLDEIAAATTTEEVEAIVWQ